MRRAVLKARRTVSRRIGAGIIILTVLSFSLLVLTVDLFAGLQERTEIVAGSIREDAVWATFQADREASRLVEAMILFERDPSAAAATDVTLRFDLLFSRMDLFGSGSFAVSFGDGSGIGEKAIELNTRSTRLAEHIDRTGGDAAALQANIAPLLAEARGIRMATGELIVAANATVNALRVEARATALAIYWRIGAAVAALTLVLVLIVILLGLQLVQISRSGREIELLNQKYQRSAERAKAGSHAKSAFLATMSHEIRTPLNGIIGMADLMSDSQLNAEQRRQLDVILRSGDMLLDVISDILDYSKLEAGAMTIERSAMNLPDMVESVRTIMAPRIRPGLVLTMSAAPDQITADPSRLRQILINLVGNAVKFTPSGTIAVRAALDGCELTVTVCDSGPGITPEQQGKLFREFSQVDGSSTRLHGGTGLGLAICKRLVEAMSGTIGVESEPGRGSTFWFKVPVGPVAPLAMVRLPAMTAVAPPALAGRVLVVDDNAINRDVAAGLLQRLGCTVDRAENGADALTAMAECSYDLILMDMQMPILDGPSATRMARAQGHAMPIIGLTANAFQTDRDICLAAGMNGHVAKPLTRDKLLAALQGKLVGRAAIGAPHAWQGTVDLDYQATLIEEFGPERFAALLSQFKTELPLLTDASRAAQARGDAKAYDDALHTLKGAALALGLTGIADAAEALRGSAADIEAQLANLDETSRALAA